MAEEQYHVLLRPVRPLARDSDTFSTCTDAFPSLPPAPATTSLAVRLACPHLLAPVAHDDALDVTDGHCLLFSKIIVYSNGAFTLFYYIQYNIDVDTYTC